MGGLSMPRPQDLAIAAKIGAAASENALALVEESDLLEEHDHHARAFVSAVLAMEETGKAWAAHVLLQLAEEDEDDSELWGAFWEIARHHESKINAALCLEQGLPAMAGLEPDEMAKALGTVASEDIYRKKLRGMYVDEEGGHVVEPEEMAADPEVRELTRKLTKAVTVWAVILQMSFEAAP
jgi:AbiV family abortive infection protein